MATAIAAGFRPLHDAHAIEQLVVNIQFGRPLTDEEIRGANEALLQFEEVLPGRADIRGVGFQFGPMGVMPITSNPIEGPSGVVRSFTDGRGVVVKELRVERQAFGFRTQAYTRWEAIWSETWRYVEALGSLIEEAGVGSYGLGYVDKFIWNGTIADYRAQPLFRSDSPYVTPRSLESEDLWHCHSGRFVRASAAIKRLEVVDIDCLDEVVDPLGRGSQTQRSVRISTTITDLFNQLGFEAHAARGRPALDEVSTGINVLHDELKRVIFEIISAEMAVHIGLTSNATE